MVLLHVATAAAASSFAHDGSSNTDASIRHATFTTPASFANRKSTGSDVSTVIGAGTAVQSNPERSMATSSTPRVVILVDVEPIQGSLQASIASEADWVGSGSCEVLNARVSKIWQPRHAAPSLATTAACGVEDTSRLNGFFPVQSVGHHLKKSDKKKFARVAVESSASIATMSAALDAAGCVLFGSGGLSLDHDCQLKSSLPSISGVGGAIRMTLASVEAVLIAHECATTASSLLVHASAAPQPTIMASCETSIQVDRADGHGGAVATVIRGRFTAVSPRGVTVNDPLGGERDASPDHPRALPSPAPMYTVMWQCAGAAASFRSGSPGKLL